MTYDAILSQAAGRNIVVDHCCPTEMVDNLRKLGVPARRPRYMKDDVIADHLSQDEVLLTFDKAFAGRLRSRAILLIYAPQNGPLTYGEKRALELEAHNRSLERKVRHGMILLFTKKTKHGMRPI